MDVALPPSRRFGEAFFHGGREAASSNMLQAIRTTDPSENERHCLFSEKWLYAKGLGLAACHAEAPARLGWCLPVHTRTQTSFGRSCPAMPAEKTQGMESPLTTASARLMPPAV